MTEFKKNTEGKFYCTTDTLSGNSFCVLMKIRNSLEMSDLLVRKAGRFEFFLFSGKLTWTLAGIITFQNKIDQI